jgi:hypothetical protein
MKLWKYTPSICSQCSQYFGAEISQGNTLGSATPNCYIQFANSYLANVSSPTLFSGLDLVFEWQTMLTASCWAWSRLGMKSPFRMNSLLSTLKFKNAALAQKIANQQAWNPLHKQSKQIIQNNEITPLTWNDMIVKN